MDKVEIINTEELDGGWLVHVSVGERSYEVGVSRDYYQKIAGDGESIEQLVERSFAFLLEREPAESIMSRFELSVISRYFPEYESTIQEQM